ncbi:hypothetical protein Bca52824_059708 [Brassica carinata]|uniref:MATH domain-containing protein n=1 Tax=Brassica carinata TaxID=52824 RepID=A0A8X7QX13_BRACI|nr:hypothetical protein Bca52824_059708 [Brassica carinata]
MEDHKPTSFTFEIDNLLEKEAEISSPTFSSGGCQCMQVFIPKEMVLKITWLYTSVLANSGSLQLGWKRRAKFSFVLLNQSGKEFYKSTGKLTNKTQGWIRDFRIVQSILRSGFRLGYCKGLDSQKLKEKGFMEKSKLIVKVQVQVLEVVSEAEVTGNETMDVGGFKFFILRIFSRHPDIALNFRPKSQLVKTTYMNLLLKLIEKLDKPPHSFSETELSNTRT